jgi:hypothetical protein
VEQSKKKENNSQPAPQGVSAAEGGNQSWLTEDGYNFDAIEQSVLLGRVAFGNPHSRLTPHEQFLHWKQAIESGQFESRDAWYNTMATY